MRKFFIIMLACALFISGCSKNTINYSYEAISSINGYQYVLTQYNVSIDPEKEEMHVERTRDGDKNSDQLDYSISAEDIDILAEVNFEIKKAEEDGPQSKLFVGYLHTCVADYLDACYENDQEKIDSCRNKICVFLGAFGTHGYFEQ